MAPWEYVFDGVEGENGTYFWILKPAAAAASSITDDAERMAEYQALEKQIVEEDAAWVPLLGNVHLFAVGERVESFTPYWAGYSNFYAKDVVLK